MVTVGGHSIDVSNTDKIFFPRTGITKGDLIDYYRRIADTMLPHIRERALTVQRFPDGLDGEGWFQKEAPDYFPDWFDRRRMKAEKGSVTYPVVNNAASLVYLANQAVITLHVALAEVDAPEQPDRLIFDLDPSDNSFRKVQDAARYLHATLSERNLPSFVETTGSRGLHVLVPIKPDLHFDQVRRFARQIAYELATAHPELMTVEHRKNKRGDRVFVDYLRNAYGQTAVAPYSVRAKEGAPVATPLDWEEALSRDMAPDRYTLRNIFRRLARKPDPWAEINRRTSDLRRVATEA